MTAILAFGVGWAEEVVCKTLTFSSETNSQGVSSYTASWSATINDFTWSIVNFNNNNNGWNYIKCGRKTNPSVASITTESNIDNAITKVVVTVDAYTNGSCNSATLEVDSNPNFNSDNKQTISAAVAKGSVVYTITNPTENCYYRLTYDMAGGSSNGLLTISKVEYYAESSEIQPSTAPTAGVTFDPASGSTINIGSTVTLALNGSASGIKYTTDGSAPTADSDTYTAPIAVTGTNGGTFTIKAIAFNTNGSDYAASTAGVATATYTLSQPQSTTYNRVNSLSANDVDRKFLLVCEAKNAGMGAIGTYGASVALSNLSNGTATINNESVLPVTLGGSEGHWTLQTDDGKYVSWTSGNSLAASDDSYDWSITFEDDNVFIASVATPDRKIRYNATNPRFACYTSAQTDIQLYGLAEGSTPTVAAPTIEGTTPFDEQTTVTITAADGASIYYTLDGSAPTTESTPYTAPFTIAATTTVKAIAVLDGVTSQVATKEFVANVTVATIAAYKELAAGTEFKFTGNVTVTYQNGSNLYVKDATGAALIYGSGVPSFTQGQVLAAGWTAKTKNYNGLLEAETPNGLSATDQTVEVAPTEMAVNTITTANDNEYIIVKNVAVSAVDNRNFTITDANGNTIAGRTNFNSVTHPTDLTKRYDVTCCVAEYNSNVQLYPTAYELVEEPVTSDLTVTITPTGGAYDAPVTVTLAVENAQGDYEVYYTLDGSDPSGSGATAYTVPFTLYESSTVRAYVLDEELNEATAEATYTITLPEFAITPNVAPGTYYSSQTVTFAPTNAVEPVSIVYTMTTADGTTDGEADGEFTVTINKTATIEVMAEDGAGRSFEGSFAYTIEVFTPAEQFKLVTSLDQLEAGKQIILAGVKTATGMNPAVYVMNTTGSNNRQSTVIDGADELPTLIDYADGYDVLVLGTSEGYYTFFEVANNGYLQATSSTKNQMGSGELNNNALAQISLEDGEFGVVFSQSSNRKNLRFNPSNNPPLFSCYASGQNPVYIYIENTGDEQQYAIDYAFDQYYLWGDESNPVIAQAGDEMSMTIYAMEGHYVDQVTVTDANGNPVEATVVDDFSKSGSIVFHQVEVSFTMPASAVTVTATAGEGLCPRMLTVNVVAEHGSCSIENVTDPNDVIEAGDRIRLNLSDYYPDFTITGVDVVDADGNNIDVERDGESTFFFTMPATSVTATFHYEAVKFAITTEESNLYTIGTLPDAESVSGQTVKVRAMLTYYDHYRIKEVNVYKVNEYNGLKQDVIYTLTPDDEGWCEFVMPSHPVHLEATVCATFVGVTFAADHKWATWYDVQDFSLPEGIEAYAVTSVQGDVAVIESISYIPAGVGVLLYSETPAEIVEANVIPELSIWQIPYTDPGLLDGVMSDRTITDGYVLYNDNFVLTTGGTLPGHRCYLPASNVPAGAPRMLRIVNGNGDVITAIGDLNADGSKAVKYVDIYGHVSDRPFDGVNIVVNADGTTTKIVR